MKRKPLKSFVFYAVWWGSLSHEHKCCVLNTQLKIRAPAWKRRHKSCLEPTRPFFYWKIEWPLKKAFWDTSIIVISFKLLAVSQGTKDACSISFFVVVLLFVVTAFAPVAKVKMGISCLALWALEAPKVPLLVISCGQHHIKRAVCI